MKKLILIALIVLVPVFRSGAQNNTNQSYTEKYRRSKKSKTRKPTAVFETLLIGCASHEQNWHTITDKIGSTNPNTPDTNGKTIMSRNPAVLVEKDSLKIRKNKRKKQPIDSTHSPYPTKNIMVKPLPYNSYRENPPPPGKPPLPVGEIIRDVILPKKNN